MLLLLSCVVMGEAEGFIKGMVWVFGKSSLLAERWVGAGRRLAGGDLFGDSCKNWTGEMLSGIGWQWGPREMNGPRKTNHQSSGEMQIKLQGGITSHLSGLLLSKPPN